jgi:hypothetical protein
MALEILKLFHSFEDGRIVKYMNDNYHNDDQKYISKNHLENSTWAHTMMCLNYFLTTNKKVYYNSDVFVAIVIAIICHDIGKIYTREIQEDGRVTFRNHPAASIAKTIDFLYYIRHTKIIKDFDYVINLVLPAVSNHINLYNDSKNKHLYFNNNSDLYEVCLQLGKSDSMGSLCEDRKFKQIDYDHYTKDKNYDRTCYIFCGLPGVGKDYIAKKMGLLVLSFDNERVKIYKESKEFEYKLTPKELYENAFKYCEDRKIDLLKLLIRRAKRWVGNIAVCNTNLNAKSRRSLINSLGKCHFRCVYVISDMETILERNKNRSSKTVDEEIIMNMAMNQTMPSIREGFDEVRIIAN